MWIVMASYHTNDDATALAHRAENLFARRKIPNKNAYSSKYDRCGEHKNSPMFLWRFYGVRMVSLHRW